MATLTLVVRARENCIIWDDERTTDLENIDNTLLCTWGSIAVNFMNPRNVLVEYLFELGRAAFFSPDVWIKGVETLKFPFLKCHHENLLREKNNAFCFVRNKKVILVTKTN